MKASISLLPILLFAFAGCASNAPAVSHAHDSKQDFSGYKAFAFVESDSGKAAMEAEGKPLDEGMKVFKDAVAAELSAKGYQMAEIGEASFWVHIYAGVNRQLVFEPREFVTSTEFDKGEGGVDASLFIDVVDPTDKKVVWRGAKEGHFTDDEAARRDEVVAASVKEILADFPPD